MTAFRSILFNVLFFGGVLFWSVVLLWTLLLPHRTSAKIVSLTFIKYQTLIEKYVLGITLKVRGWEHVPKSGPYIIAAKHQSAFETLKLPFMKRLGFPAIILKKGLALIPIFGWYFPGMGHIPIDRGEGAAAMNSILRGCRRVMETGRPVIIFPQGTRVGIGAHKPYKAGIAKVYRDLKVPVVPMALNSGLFWGRNAFRKKPGTVVFEFLPPIPAGLPPLQMMERLEKETEEATDRLVAESKGKQHG